MNNDLSKLPNQPITLETGKIKHKEYDGEKREN